MGKTLLNKLSSNHDINSNKYSNNMINILKECLWKNFGAGIDMLKNAIVLWPEEYWNTSKKFFYNAYHCLVFLDYYLTIPSKNFSSMLPFTLKEPRDIPKDAIDDVVPDRIYSKEELLNYLQSNRKKCHDLIAGLTEEKLKTRWMGPYKILKRYSAVSYKVDLPEKLKNHQVLHVSRLLRCNNNKIQI